jgi:hypothetical protein
VPEFTAITALRGRWACGRSTPPVPGRLGRLESLALYGREAGVRDGRVLLLFVAGLIEGVFRQMVTSVPVRYSVVAAGFAFLAWWFGVCGRERERRP